MTFIKSLMLWGLADMTLKINLVIGFKDLIMKILRI